MLARIQHLLTDLYDVEVTASVDDFVCGEAVARAVVGDAVCRGEVLVVVDDPEDASVGLYVAPDVLERVRRTAAWPPHASAPPAGDRRGAGFRAYCLATEGVSHFVYLMFRAEHEAAVSQLELEVQGEVDKYAAALVGERAGPRAGHSRGALWARSRALRWHLFARADFRDAPETDEGERYRVAHRLASRYTAALEARHVARGDLAGLATELRRFYRMSLREKMEAVG